MNNWFWFAGLIGAGWFAIVSTWPPENLFYRALGVMMGFASIGNFILSGATKICDVIKETKK